MRKKLLILLIMILFTFTACDTDSKKSSVPEETEEVLVVKSDDKKDSETEEILSLVEEVMAGYSKGILKEESWESKWMGIRFVAPEGMRMVTQEELDELMGFTSEVLSDDFSEAQIEYVEMSTVQEMLCYAPDGVSHTLVAVEKLPGQTDMDTYITALENTLSKVSDLTFSVISRDEVVSIGGREFRKVKCVASYDGIELHQDYLLRMKDDRVISIIGTYLDESLYEKMLAGYEAY